MKPVAKSAINYPAHDFHRDEKVPLRPIRMTMQTTGFIAAEFVRRSRELGADIIDTV